MRIPALVCSLGLLAGCATVQEPQARQAAREDTGKPRAAAAVKPAIPAAPPESVRATHGGFSGIAFEGVAFDSRSHRLVVADQAGGPGSQFPDAATAGRARGGIAAVNGGFFTPAGAPLGLVIAAGTRAGDWNTTSSLGSGVWQEDATGRSSISRRENPGRSATATPRELLQAGPMLVAHGRMVAGLDPHKPAVRTLLCWDGGSRWWLGRASTCTLAELAAALTHGQPAGWPVRHALNLDGGRSSDLWISAAVAGGACVHPPPMEPPGPQFPRPPEKVNANRSRRSGSVPKLAVDKAAGYASFRTLHSLMKPLAQATVACVSAACFGLPSCAGLRNAGKSSVAMVRNSTAAATAKLSDLPLTRLLSGPKVKVVEVREKELKKLPTGHERALAFESERKRGFWFFGGPVDFKEPTLPEPGSELDGSLLPPRIP